MLSTNLVAQKTGIEGTIRDENRNRLDFVGIIDTISGLQLGNTKTDGSYFIELQSGTDYVISYRYLGTKRKYRKVNLKEGEIKRLDITLVSTTTIRKAEVFGHNERTGPISRIPTKIISSIPSLGGGIEDVLRMAPVNSSNELSASYSVRGGSFDENLVYVNGIEVYRPFLVRSGQQEGLSFPNPDMVQNIIFSAGGFDAKYGDKLSSVLDITYTNPEQFSGSFTGSFLGGAIQFEDRTITGKDNEDPGYFSHNTGVRYKSNTYILGTLDTDGQYNPNFVDVQTYLTWKPKKYGKFEYSFLGNYSRNQYNFVPTSRETDVGTINEALRFSVFFEGQEESQFETFFGAFSAKILSTEDSYLRFTVSAFKTYENEHFDIFGQYRLDELERDFGSDDFGEVLRNRGIGGFREHARNDLEASVLNFTHRGGKAFSGQNFIEWGFKLQNEQILDQLSEWRFIDSAGYASPSPPDNIGYVDVLDRPFQEIQMRDLIKATNDINSNRATAFIQQKLNWEKPDTTKYTLTYGIRGTYWTFNNEFVGGPRAQFSYQPNWHKQTSDSTRTKRDYVFSLSGGYYFQPAFYKELRGLYGDLNPDIRSQRAIHIVASADHHLDLWERPFKLRGEMYYKHLNFLIPYEVENVRQRYYATNNSDGYAAGLDVMMNGQFIPGVESWLRASLLKTDEDIQDDSYIQYINTEGVAIIPGFTFNDTIADSTTVFPGYIPRPADQRFSFSMIFKDQMKRWPEYKVIVSMFYATGLPYGPPTFERYKDVLRLPAYRRVDIGFSRDFFSSAKYLDKHGVGEDKFVDRSGNFIKSGWISLEVFNILGINNTNNYTWVEDVNGRQYGIANFLTGRRVNLKLHFDF